MLSSSLWFQDIEIFVLTLKYVYAIGWAIAEKNQTEWVEDMEFPEVLKK